MRNPGTRAIARDHHLSDRTVRNVAHEDIRNDLMLVHMQERRLFRAKTLLDKSWNSQENLECCGFCGSFRCPPTHLLCTPSFTSHQICGSPNSSDLNSIDYNMWGVVEQETYQRSKNTTDSLKAAIARIMSTFHTYPVMRVWQRFWSCTETKITPESGLMNKHAL